MKYGIGIIVGVGLCLLFLTGLTMHNRITKLEKDRDIIVSFLKSQQSKKPLVTPPIVPQVKKQE